MNPRLLRAYYWWEPYWYAVLGGALFLAACWDSSGVDTRSAAFSVQPVIDAQASPQDFGLVIDSAFIAVIRRSTGEEVASQGLPFLHDTTVSLLVPIHPPAEEFQVELELLGGGTLLYGGMAPVLLHEGENPSLSVRQDYAGPGKNAIAVAVTGDTVLTLGDPSQQLGVVATNPGGSQSSIYVVKWSSSDTSVVGVSERGQVSARGLGRAEVTAATPAGLTSQFGVWVVRRVTRLLADQNATGPDSVVVGGAVRLVARVVGADGGGVPFVPVWFEALTDQGPAPVGQAVSDTSGLAVVPATVGQTIGRYRYQARIHAAIPDSVASFDITAVSGAFKTLHLDRSSQTAFVGDTLLLIATATDAFSNPIAGLPVQFVVTQGQGSVWLPGDRITGADGVAANRWVLGQNAGTQQLEVRALNPVDFTALQIQKFTATALARGASQLTFTSQPAGAVAGESFGSQVVVAVRDTFGNPITSTTDTVRLVLDGEAGQAATLSGTPWALPQAGVASFSDLRITRAGAGYTLRATLGTLQSSASQAFAVAAASPSSIAVTGSGATLSAVGSSVQLTSAVADAYGNPVQGASITWASSNPSVATVDANGLVSAVGNGTVRISALIGATVLGYLDLTVAQAVMAVSVTTPSQLLSALGERVQLVATATDAKGHPVPDALVTWASSDPAVATVDAAGLVTAVGNGDVVVTAAVGPSVVASVALHVEQAAVSVRVTPGEATLSGVGQSVQLQLTGLDANGNVTPGVSATWSSSNPQVATVSDAGLVTAVGPGDVTITAAAGGSVVGSVTLEVTVQISVTPATSTTPAVVAVHVAPADITLTALGSTAALTATPVDAQGQPVPGAAVTWSSSNAAVAAVDGSGTVRALSNGGAVITALSAGIAGRANITVAQVVTSVSITPASVTLSALGAAASLAAVLEDAGGTLVVGAPVAWSSSDPAVATVSASGLVTAVGNGTATIRAASGSVSGAAAIMVAQVAAAVAVNPGSVSLTALGATAQLGATVADANGHLISGAVVAWTSSDPAIATVSGSGLVTAVGNGTATITATSGGVSGTATVVVTQAVASVTVEPAGVTLPALGGTQQLTAVARDAGGQLVSGVVVSWASENEQVATVSGSGLVTAVANGATRVTATVGGVSGAARVTVSQTVATVTVTPHTVTLTTLGATQQLEAGVADANGHAVSGSVTWTSSNAAVVTVDASGLVTAVGNGTATVTASSGGVSGSVVVNVVMGATPLTVMIELKPTGGSNPVNLAAQGVTPVAILTTSTSVGEPVTFNAASVNVASVVFAQATPVGSVLQDVDGDGDLDLLLKFSTADLQLTQNSTAAVLEGRTNDGQAIRGETGVQMVPSVAPRRVRDR